MNNIECIIMENFAAASASGVDAKHLAVASDKGIDIVGPGTFAPYALKRLRGRESV
ncbi:hypothetical protein ACHAQF_003127 [Verticillium nonalfalfae]